MERIVVRREYADVGAVTEFGNFEESLAEVKRLAKERGIPLAEA